MDEKLQNKLFEKYPVIFQESKLSPMVSCMGRGICVEKGWYDILNILCSAIQTYIDYNNECFDKGYDYYVKRGRIKPVVFLQVKQKFAKLTIYHKGGDEYTNGLIDFAMNYSYRICETCGSNVNVGRNIKGWHHTICKECFLKEKSDFISGEIITENNLNEFWVKNE